MTTQVSAPAAPATTKPVIRPRAFVPGIEYKGNIEKAKGLIKSAKFEEAADVVRDNSFAPDFLIGDITRLAPAEVTVSLLCDFSSFLRNALKPESVEKRGMKMSALLRASVRFSVPQYFEEKQKLTSAITATGAKVPRILVDSCVAIEADLKRRLTPTDWAHCGFELMSSNPGQMLYRNPDLNQTIVINTPKVKPTTEAEKAKARDHEQGERRARQLERAAKYPGKQGGGGGGNKKEEGGKKGKKK